MLFCIDCSMHFAEQPMKWGWKRKSGKSRHIYNHKGWGGLPPSLTLTACWRCCCCCGFAPCCFYCCCFCCCFNCCCCSNSAASPPPLTPCPAAVTPQQQQQFCWSNPCSASLSLSLQCTHAAQQPAANTAKFVWWILSYLLSAPVNIAPMHLCSPDLTGGEKLNIMG